MSLTHKNVKTSMTFVHQSYWTFLRVRPHHLKNVHWYLEKHPVNLIYNFYVGQISLIFLLALFLS